jgi:membrane protease YdiL (CAAX protease family)
MAPQSRVVLPFFLLTFAITWGLQLPGVLAQQGFLPGRPEAYLPFVGLGILGPLLAATLLTARHDGRSAVRELYGRLLLWRVNPLWYVAALLVPALLLSALLGLLQLAGRQGPLVYFPAAGALVAGLVISVAEEIGWRGYALPRLEARYGAFLGSVLLGVAWYLWHIPMFLGQDVPMNLVLVMLLFFTGASLYMSWIARGTGQSLLLASLAHWGAHLNNSHRALPGDVVPLLAHTIVYALLGLFLVAWVGRQWATGKPQPSSENRRSRPVS